MIVEAVFKVVAFVSFLIISHIIEAGTSIFKVLKFREGADFGLL